MKQWTGGRTLSIGVGLIMLTNAVALGGVWWNRSATPESALTLSERELGLPWRSLRFAEDSGLSLNLNWRVGDHEAGEFVSGYTFNGGTPEWLDAGHMAALGFAPGNLDSDGGRQRYTRQLPREVVLVMELGGPLWQRALARARENAGRHAAAAAANGGSKQFADRAKRASDELAREENASSRLFVIDAGLDARQLREKYPDRSRFLLLYGTVRPTLRDRGSDAAQATGYVSRISTGRIHVPHALRRPLESARAVDEPGGVERFSAELLVGQRLEPWIVELKPVVK
ncbi:MAG: DUF4824 family protein [Dechloromonas sp.]|nr:DUF4824 family protein [Dechloromonas sp.]